MKDKDDKKNLKRVAVDCIYRAVGRSREFTTPANFEAFNMLMNKLDRMEVVHQPGRLIFEFIPGEMPKDNPCLTRQDIDSQMCVCGHNRFAHGGAIYGHQKACQVDGCGCRKYKPKP